MTRYAQHVSTKNPQTPQSEQAHPDQVLNNAGGYTFKVDKWERAKRFLILGNEGGSYYSSERKLTKEAAESLIDCSKENLSKLIELIRDISLNGRAPKQDPIIFALALLSQHEGVLRLIPEILRTSTHLFQFINNVKEFRGWGVTLKRAVANWYESKTANQLAYQVTKYPQRYGVSHRDVLRLAHPRAVTPEHSQLYDFITTYYRDWSNIEDKGSMYNYQLLNESGNIKTEKLVTKPELLPFTDIQGLVEAKNAKSTKDIVKIIRKFKLMREHIPNSFLGEVDVWDALLPHMPLMAMVRNLNKMTAVGLFPPLSTNLRLVCEKLANEEILSKSRIHPAQLLLAMRTYAAGRSDKGNFLWLPIGQIVSGLEDAFYNSFKYVRPSNKRFLIGVDVSGSMQAKIANSSISSAEAATAIAMTIVRTELEHYVFGFNNTFVDLNINKNMTLAEVLKQTSSLNFGPTDCAIPMLYAAENKIPVDVFVVITDHETWFGRIHPHEALNRYRQKMGIPAKLAVIATQASDFSIADPTDINQMDFVGFDTMVPKLLTEFAQGFNCQNENIVDDTD